MISTRPTEEQKSVNEMVMFNFTFAMMNLDHTTILELLSDTGVYLGKFNKWQFAYWLKKRFDKIPKNNFGVSLEEILSADYFPGNVGYCFHYGESNSEGVIAIKSTIKLIMEVKEGRIHCVRIPRKYAPAALKDKFQMEN
jgi:hypothetical protein